MTKMFVDVCSRRKRASAGKAVIMAALLILGTSIFFAHSAFAGGFALSGVGSKAIGMGGAFRGLADDWSAAYWNPAGLTQVKQTELNGMLVAISPRASFNPDIMYGTLDVGYRNGSTRYASDNTELAPDFSGFFNIPSLKGYTMGLAIYVPFGLGSEWDLMNPVNRDLARPFPGIDHKTDLNIIDIHPTVAREFLDGKLSVGAGLAIQRGSITFEKTYLKGSGLPAPHEYLYIDGTIKGDGWGIGGNFGLLYKFNDKLQFGLSGRTGTTIKFSGTSRQELYTLNNNDLRNILLDNATSLAESASVHFLFDNNLENHVAIPSAKGDFKTPADFGFGIAYKASPKLTFTGDIAYTNWSRLDSILINLDGADPSGAPAQNSVIYLHWKNTLRFSLGAEYWVKDYLGLRFGYYLDPSPVPDNSFTPLIPDVGDKNSYNIGTALKFSGIELAYNFEYIGFKDRTVSALVDNNGDKVYDNYPGSYKMSVYASHLSITYRF